MFNQKYTFTALYRCILPVSYTHLDVYKRQVMKAGDPEAMLHEMVAAVRKAWDEVHHPGR